MPSKSRGGLSKREYTAKQAGVSASSKLAKATTQQSPTSQYSALMKKYEKTLSPSSTEKKAQKSLDKLTTSYEGGVAKTGQETMPMDLITGQKKGLLDQYGVQAGTYQRTIAGEQAKRGAASDILSAESRLVESQMSAEADKAKQSQDFQNQLALIAARKSGGSAKKTSLQSVSKKVGRTTVYGTFDPTTGEYKWSE